MNRPLFLVNKLKSPYFLETRLSKRWLSCIRTSVFVFLFLVIFQPFGLSHLPEGLIRVTLGYGLITFSVMAVLNILCVPFLPRFFSEEGWTVSRELFWNLVNILLIGFANILYSVWIGVAPFTWQAILTFELFTISLAVFPVTLTAFIKEARLKNKFEKRSEEINAFIGIQPEPPVSTKEKEQLIISSENEKEKLSVTLDDLLFIEASDNYVEVHYLERGIPQKKLLRSSLKAIVSTVQDNPQLFRCHKSFLVNTKQVKRISGNAQGYKLHLKDSEQIIPVSRQFNNNLKERLGF
jgi:hypothetical protein